MRKYLIFLVVVGTPPFAGCRNRTIDTSKVSAAAAQSMDCDHLEPLGFSKASGEDIFNLTSSCIFDRSTHEVRIKILSETFQKVLDDGCAGKKSGYGHVLELYLDGKIIKNVGIKTRGNTSRCNPKRQFAFKFDTREMFSVFQGAMETKSFPENADRTFFGLEGFSIRASANDPSMIRERVSSHIFTSVESLAPTTVRGGMVYRVGFTKFLVSFNRSQSEGPEGSFTNLIDGYYYDYKGLYSITENIDRTFLRTRFQAGNHGADAPFLFGADVGKASFDRSSYSRDGWEAVFVNGKKGSDANQAAAEAKLFELFDLLKNHADEVSLTLSIDIDNIVNYMAAAIFVGHWDSLLANRNNDFLLFNDAKKKWQLITWDLDNSEGAGLDQYHQLMSDELYQPAKVNKEALFQVVFAENHPTFRAKLKDRLRGLLAGEGAQSSFDDYIDRLATQMRTSMAAWEGYNSQSYQDIKNFANARRQKLRSQL